MLLLATLSALSGLTLADEAVYFALSERNLFPRQGGNAFIPQTAGRVDCPAQNTCGRNCVFRQGESCCAENCEYHLTYTLLPLLLESGSIG